MSLDKQSKAVLMILDGMGLNEDPKSSATTAESMPYVHSLMQQYGYARLHASGTPVGLDDGKAGNSEVGHLTIGAGKLLLSTLARVREGYQSGDWEQSSAGIIQISASLCMWLVCSRMQGFMLTGKR